jgi:hypothetical protein
MSQKSRYIFVMPAEFVEWVRELVTSGAEHVVLDPYSPGRLEHWDGSTESLLASDNAIFTGDLANLEGVTSSNYIPGLLGWVVVGVPRIQGSSLFCVQLAARSDWYDRDRREVMEKRDAMKRFDRIWRKWKPRVRSPMRARDRVTGAEHTYKDLRYSAGAEEWVRRGGVLRQEGVMNQEFLLPEPPG